MSLAVSERLHTLRSCCYYSKYSCIDAGFPGLTDSFCKDVLLLSDYDRTERSARGAKEDVKDGYQDAKDNVRGSYYDAKDSVKDGYYDAKDSVKDGYYDAKHTVKDKYNEANRDLNRNINSVKDSYRDTKNSIKDKYNEANRDLNRNIDNAKQSWHDSLTPHSYVSMLQNFLHAAQYALLAYSVVAHLICTARCLLCSCCITH